MLTLNADDFGLHPAVNRAVARAFDAGALTSASLLANGPAFDDAVAIARARPGLAVGVHLNLLRGRPVSPPVLVRTLIDERGRFLGSAIALALRGLRGAIARAEIFQECKAQITRVRAAGIAPAHLDAEKHAHHYVSGFFDAVLALARDERIARVRVVRERIALEDALERPRRALFAAFLTAIGRRFAGRARRAGVAIPDEVTSVVRTGRLREIDVRAAIARARSRSIELFAHPGEPLPNDEPIDESMGRLRITDGWRGELDALLAASGPRV